MIALYGYWQPSPWYIRAQEFTKLTGSSRGSDSSEDLWWVCYELDEKIPAYHVVRAMARSV